MAKSKVLEMISKGNSQTEIAGILKVDLSIVSRDVSHLRQQAKQNIKKYIDERLPEEYEKCLVGLTSILKEAWNTESSFYYYYFYCKCFVESELLNRIINNHRLLTSVQHGKFV
jgi:predicted transcriptional regulator